VYYPMVRPNDVWVGYRSDSRWRIESVAPAATLRGEIIVCRLTLRYIPRTDVLYGSEATDLIDGTVAPAPTGNEHGWETKDNANCIDEFDY